MTSRRSSSSASTFGKPLTAERWSSIRVSKPKWLLSIQKSNPAARAAFSSLEEVQITYAGYNDFSFSSRSCAESLPSDPEVHRTKIDSPSTPLRSDPRHSQRWEDGRRQLDPTTGVRPAVSTAVTPLRSDKA